MRSFVSLVIALFLLAATSFAQDQAAYTKSFNEGIAALNAGRLDEGIAAFKKCLEILPTDPIASYNLACGYAKKGEKDTAFEWLDKTATRGFGNLDDQKGVSNVVFCQGDTDLTVLHEDPRWAKFIEKLTLLRKPFDDLRGTSVYIPDSLKDAAEFPLLVVLHDAGGSRHSIFEGRWKKIADELGCVLIAPSGKLAVKFLDAGAGLAWFNQSYATTYTTDEKPVADAIAEFEKTHKLAPDRVFIAGEGMGAMVAFNIAIARRSKFKGVLLVNGIVNGSMAAARVPGAVKVGLRVHAILDKAALSKAAGKDAQPLIDNLTKSLNGWTLINKVESFEPKEGEADPTDAMALAALKSFQVPLPAPVDAGSGK